MDFVEVQAGRYPELAAQYEEMGALFAKKLWHELTLALEKFVNDDSCVRGDNLYELYTEFLSKFEGRLSPIKLAQLLGVIGSKLSDQAKAVEFYHSILSSPKTRLGAEAELMLQTEIIVSEVGLGLKDSAFVALNKVQLRIADQEQPITESVVHSKYHYATAVYRKAYGPASDFYRAVLMYVAYTPLEQIPLALQRSLAIDLTITAVVSEDIYNFGEVLCSPVMKSLEGTSEEWLRSLVHALDTSNIDGFNVIMASPEAQSRQELRDASSAISQKVQLLGLMNLVFKKPSHDRTLTFLEISQSTHVPVDKVEWLLMKAMSLGLVKGSINEVEQIVSMSWVQPRVLSRSDVALVQDQLGSWIEKVKDTLLVVEDQAAEL